MPQMLVGSTRCHPSLARYVAGRPSAERKMSIKADWFLQGFCSSPPKNRTSHDLSPLLRPALIVGGGGRSRVQKSKASARTWLPGLGRQGSVALYRLAKVDLIALSRLTKAFVRCSFIRCCARTCKEKCIRRETRFFGEVWYCREIWIQRQTEGGGSKQSKHI